MVAPLKTSQAFTLIELMIVISIIVVLAGLLMAGIGNLQRSRMRAHTSMILAVAGNGIERSALDRGGAVAGAPHPLSEHEDLTTVAPHLRGVEQQRLRVFGASGKGLTTLVDDGSVQQQRDRHEGDEFYGDVWYNAWSRSVRGALGDSMDRLAELGALRTPKLVPLSEPEESIWLVDQHLRFYDGDDSPDVGSEWLPGRVFDDGEWQPYAMPGPAIFDPYGTEILMYNDDAGRTVLVSAGPDGSFRLIPGSVDEDAQEDNIVLFGEK